MAPTSTLTVVFANLKSCFVNLPPSWSNALWERLKTLKAGDVVLQLSWKDETTNQKAASSRAYVSWTGGTCASSAANSSRPSAFPASSTTEQYLEIDGRYGRALGLKEGQKVSAEFCKSVQPGSSVNVEPLTADDWEILELHAGYLEEQFLNQVRVVWKGQVITIWVQSQALIRVRVVETDPSAECVKLDTNAEVIIAPKKRGVLGTSPVAPETMDISNSAPADKQLPRVTRRLLPLLALSPPYNDAPCPTILIPSSDVLPSAMPDGSLAFISEKKCPRLAPQEHSEAAADASEGLARPNGLHVRVYSSKAVPAGHVWANRATYSLLSLPPFAKLCLQRSREDLKRPARFSVHRIADSRRAGHLTLRPGRDETEDLAGNVKKVLSRALEHTEKLVITDGAPILLEAAAPSSTQSVIVRFPEGKPKDVRDQLPYSVLERENMDSMTISAGEEVTVPESEATTSEPTVPSLGGVNAILEELTLHIRNRLSYDMLRASLHSPSLGGILLYGARGCGKSSIAMLVARQLSLDAAVFAHTVLVDCAGLAGERVPKVKEAIEESFDRAAWSGPSIVIFDDLDRLIPAEQEQGDSSRSRQLAELFLDAVSRASSRSKVAIVGISQQQTSLHASLISSHLFTEIIHIMPPNKDQRQEILQTIVKGGPAALLDSYQSLDLLPIAGATEGYTPADLRTLMKRAVHEAAIRRLSTEEPMLEESVAVTQEDVEQAQKGYIPASLRGLKLESSGVAWSDIGGLWSTKRVLLETLEWPTKYAQIFANCSLRLRSGLLLYGFPGCGKTLLASAVAKECGLNFISVKGPELLNKYIGASEQSVRDLFERATAAKPCVLFFDEFDAIAPRRGHDNTGVTDRVVNQMLTQMDGAEGLDGVYVLAATSRPDIIDPALLRPGRLDKSILCNMPEVDERLEILQTVAKRIKLDEDLDLLEFAEKTDGYSGADLQALIYNANLEAIHETIDQADQEAAGSKQGHDDSGDDKRTEYVILENATRHGKEHIISAADRGQIAQKIENIHKELRRAHETPEEKAVLSYKEPVVERRHLESAFTQTRASITPQERRRLQHIYDEFVGGKGAPAQPVGQRATLA
ncbi:P-loop containing nucleoside triphosphate hydrolase protein [Gaertneriomyces semiglobifer]|nr:P-loop containing nucleoside triphosphate hydrolase protein [Gaertneriomyces semiglobifer]